MTSGAFADEDAPPDRRALARALGAAARSWDRLIAGAQAAHGPLPEQWHFAGSKHGWSLRLKEPERVRVHLLPQRGSFQASFTLGEKACKAARTSDVPVDLLTLIDEAPRYAEGRGVRIRARTLREADGVLRLLACKAAH